MSVGQIKILYTSGFGQMELQAQFMVLENSVCPFSVLIRADECLAVVFMANFTGYSHRESGIQTRLLPLAIGEDADFLEMGRIVR